MSKHYAIGLMSGTSMDGIDAALIETDGEAHVKSVGSISLSYSPTFQLLLKFAEFFVNEGHRNVASAKKDTNDKKVFQQLFTHFLSNKLGITDSQQIQNECQQYLSDFSLLGIEKHSTKLHALVVAQLIDKLQFKTSQVDIIGYHGQTVLHKPQQQLTMQLGDAELLANLCGINVISQFRQNDILNGGQGAPLAPLYHRALVMQNKQIPCVVVNCGGIANVTIISGTRYDQLLAYDAGPGNCLLDNFVRLRTHGKYQMDVDGQFARSGSVNLDLIKLLYQTSCQQMGRNYYQTKAPKSLDVNDLQLPPEFNAINLADGCATLTYFTVDCLIQSFYLQNISLPGRWILCGGGFNNPMMLEEFRKQLDNKTQVFHANDLNWNNKALEAELFAYLAVRSQKKLPLSLPTTTGVLTMSSGGVLTKASLSL